MRLWLDWITPRIVLCLCFALPMTASREAMATDYVWDGNGDVNNGGNWSTAANWNPDGVPDGYDDTATLPAAGSNRYVTNDVATTIGTLTIPSDPRSTSGWKRISRPAISPAPAGSRGYT